MVSGRGTTRRLPAGKFFGLSKVSQQIGSVGLAESAYRQGTVLPEHAHEQHHFVFVLAGHYEEIVDSRLVERKPLQLSFLPRDVPHAERHLSSGRHFMIEPSAEALRQLPQVDLSRPADLSETEAGKLAMRIRREFWEPDPLSRLAIEALMLELLVSFGRKRADRTESSPPPFVRQAYELLCEQFTEPLTLQDVARQVGVHPVHLARSFQRWYSGSMRKLVRERRIKFACRQLLQSDSSLAEVAASAGFFDQSHFGKVFRETVGLTPAQFRRQSPRRGDLRVAGGSDLRRAV
jgi:AraC family transcriptional regulator